MLIPLKCQWVRGRFYTLLLLVIQQSDPLFELTLTLLWKSIKCFPELFVFVSVFQKGRDLFFSPCWRDLGSHTRQGSSFYDSSPHSAHPGNFPKICSPLPRCFSDPNAENDHCLTESARQSKLFLLKWCCSLSMKHHSLQECLGGRKENCSLFLISMLFTVGNILGMDLEPREAILLLIWMLWNLNPKGQSRYY